MATLLGVRSESSEKPPPVEDFKAAWAELRKGVSMQAAATHGEGQRRLNMGRTKDGTHDMVHCRVCEEQVETIVADSLHIKHIEG